MTATCFVDTNVFVYVRDRTEADKQRRAAEWIALLWETRQGRTGVQVLEEYYVTVTTKLKPPRKRDEAREDVLALGVWKPVGIDIEIIERAWSIQDRFAFSWWDALIAAAAVAGGCRFLLTEDLQDEQVVDGVTIINPFAHEPDALLES